MNAKPSLKKKLAQSHRQAVAAQYAPARTQSPAQAFTHMLDVGDWSIAQDEDGSLIIYNVFTGNKVILARP